jgi:mannan endo-1,4-beta-mannosidase
VSAANKSYFAGEFDWTGLNGGTTPTGDDLTTWFQAIEQGGPTSSGDAFWSLFGHDVPDCSVYVNHTDGFTMQYGNPANSAYIDDRIRLVRQHFERMSAGQNISANASLPVVPCPASSQPVSV